MANNFYDLETDLEIEDVKQDDDDFEMSIFDFAPKSNGAEDYLSLATEIVGAKKDETLPF